MTTYLLEMTDDEAEIFDSLDGAIENAEDDDDTQRLSFLRGIWDATHGQGAPALTPEQAAYMIEHIQDGADQDEPGYDTLLAKLRTIAAHA